MDRPARGGPARAPMPWNNSASPKALDSFLSPSRSTRTIGFSDMYTPASAHATHKSLQSWQRQQASPPPPPHRTIVFASWRQCVLPRFPASARVYLPQQHLDRFDRFCTTHRQTTLRHGICSNSPHSMLFHGDIPCGNITSVGWQVTLCDPIWHVSSRSGVATLRTAIHMLLTYLLTYACDSD